MARIVLDAIEQGRACTSSSPRVLDTTAERGASEAADAILAIPGLALLGGGGWRPIDDDPPFETWVLVHALVHGEPTVVEAIRYRPDDWMTFGANGGIHLEPTAWQPLPPPPSTPKAVQSQGDEGIIGAETGGAK